MRVGVEQCLPDGSDPYTSEGTVSATPSTASSAPTRKHTRNAHCPSLSKIELVESSSYIPKDEGRDAKRSRYDRLKDPEGQGSTGRDTTGQSKDLPLDGALLDLLQTILPDKGAYDKSRRVLLDLSRTLSRLGLQAKLFGSWATGLCIPSSDMDFAVAVVSSLSDTDGGRGIGSATRVGGLKSDSNRSTELVAGFCDPTAGQYDQRKKVTPMLRTVAKGMRKSYRFLNLLSITRTRVPIIKAVHCCGMKVDLSFQGSGLLTSQFLCNEFKKPEYRLARGLILLVKALVANWQLNDPSKGGLGSFPIAMMVLWFLHGDKSKEYPQEFENSYAIRLVALLRYYAYNFDFSNTGIDYTNKRTFSKPPDGKLYIMNPIEPHTNCAVAATTFASRVKPKLSETYSKLAVLLNYNAERHTIEGVLRDAFGFSTGNKQKGELMWKKIAPSTRGDPHDQHLWESETNIYIGNPIVL
uniref:WGS project CAEQ00000000 data, annotated contig 1169 n=1 Tax=Trypanosoma congolense (strain IL3000) TaxID=1068625 RepID=F9W4C6_TRYCI|nr:unnamed protein product [Trypanosoma congolense IL3000]